MTAPKYKSHHAKHHPATAASFNAVAKDILLHIKGLPKDQVVSAVIVMGALRRESKRLRAIVR